MCVCCKLMKKRYLEDARYFMSKAAAGQPFVFDESGVCSSCKHVVIVKVRYG